MRGRAPAAGLAVAALGATAVFGGSAIGKDAAKTQVGVL